MKKTNFTFMKSLVLLVMLAFGSQANAQSISCQDHVNVSLAADCSVALTPAMFATGGATVMLMSNMTTPNSAASASLALTFTGGSSSTGLTTPVVVGGTYIIKVLNAAGNSCWGTLKFEDKLAPVFACPADVTVACDATINISTSEVAIASGAVLGAVTAPTVVECSGYTFYYSDMVVDLPCPTPAPTGAYTTQEVYRTYRAVDVYGNSTLCAAQKISFERKAFDPAGLNVADKSYDCSDAFAKDANGNPAPSASGIPSYTAGGTTISATLACDLMVNYSDVKVNTCGSGYKVIRTWSILDWCTGKSGTKVQVIKVEDITAPKFTLASLPALSLSTSASNCFVNSIISYPAATDNCSSVLGYALKVKNALGTTVYNTTGTTISGLGIGTYTITYTAKDECGNQVSIDQALTVADNIPPVAVCRQDTKVSLTLDGTATVAAASFDEGSNDNCCFDANSFKVRKVGAATFGTSVTFNCDDCGKTVMVEMQVADCTGKTNSCMVNVTVDEKLAPVITAKNAMEICSNNADATAWLNANKPQLGSLANYPTTNNPGYYDNCPGAMVTFTDDAQINNCGAGALSITEAGTTFQMGQVVRSWTITDKGGRTAKTDQTVMSINMSAYEVKFPGDVEYKCEIGGSTDPVTTGVPMITAKGGSCPLVGVEHTDEVFTIVPGFCYKILRTWKVINWCQINNSTAANSLDPDRGAACAAANTYSNVDSKTVAASKNTASKFNAKAASVVASVCAGYDDDGYMEFTQVIKVTDNIPPVITPGTVTVTANGKECSSVVTITNGTATDCTKAATVTYAIYKKGAGGSETLVATKTTFDIATEGGDYVVRFKANDQCGNFSTSDVPFTVKDVKKPTPVCFTGLAAEIMPTSGNVMIMAPQFNNGSYDNCPGTLKIKIQSPAAKAGDSYDPAKAFDAISFDCKGPKSVSMWVGDASGNWDFCNTFIDLQTNMALAAGITVNPCPAAPANVAASIVGKVATENGSDLKDASVNVVASSYNANNMTSAAGIYTANVPYNSNVSIKPSLDAQPLNGVSTADLVAISKHILGNAKFSSAYKMIAADVNNSKTITTADLVELRKMILHVNNNFTNNTSWVFADKKQNLTVANALNYAAVVNINNIDADAKADFVAVKIGDVNGSANAAAARNANTVTFVGEDQNVKAGEVVNASFKAETAVEGYQFTMNYASSLELVSITGADFAVLENGKVTVSSVENTTFNVVFKAKANTTLSNAVKFNSSVLAAEAYTAGMEVNNIEVKFNNAAVANNGFELYQNSPNPFKGLTTISFNLPSEGAAKVSISDMTGRVIRTMEVEGVKGYNEVRVSDLNATGVLNYTVETANHTASKKMIIIE